jgi:calcineurin-like phosphoesterase
MCGSHSGILGVKTAPVLHKYLVKTPVQFEPAEGNVQLHGALFTIDSTSGKCTKTEQIFYQACLTQIYLTNF